MATGMPTFEDLKIIRRLFNSNDMRVSSGGGHGDLGLIMTNAEYFAVTTDVFLPPENPGPAAILMVGMTAVHIAETARLHTAATRIYRTYHNVDQAFKKMIIDAFTDPYLNALSHEFVGYANCTSLQLPSHILMYNTMIAPIELTQNYERLNTPYDPTDGELIAIKSR
jgi:hypothetical protein